MVQYNEYGYSMLQNYRITFLCDKCVNSRGKQIIINIFFNLNSFHSPVITWDRINFFSVI
jgi:hypothetical protein